MNLNQGLFAIKLHEMDRQYALLHSRTAILQQADHEKIRQQLAQMQGECLADDLMLEKSLSGCASPHVADMAAAQLDYKHRAEAILQKAMCDGGDAEAAALYAEYAMDFATHAARYALLAALHAADRQMTADEQREDCE